MHEAEPAGILSTVLETVQLTFASWTGMSPQRTVVVLLLAGAAGVVSVLAALSIGLARSRRRSREELDKLRASHAGILAMFDNLDEPVYVADPVTSDLLFVNQALQAMLGTPGDRKCYEYLQLREAPCPFCTNHKILGEYFGQSYVWEFQNRANGRWYKCSDRALAWPDGRIVRCEIGVDVTERKRTEDALAVTTDRLALATRAGGVGIWDHDVVHDQLAWDDQMFALYGGTRESLGNAAKAWGEGVHPDDRRRCDEGIERALRGVDEFNQEFRIVTPQGEIRHIRALASVQRDADGRPLRITGTNWDITAQKQAEVELARRVEFERLIATVSSEFVGVDSAHTDSAIERALDAIGSFVGADRAYVFFFRDEYARMDNTHEWCADGIEPQKANLQDISCAELTWWMKPLRARRTLHIASVAQMPAEAAIEKSVLESQGIQSLLVQPLYRGDEVLGFLGFDAVRTRRVWTDYEQDLLRLFSTAITHVILRRQAEESLKESEERFREIVEQSSEVFYRRNARTEEFEYVSPKVQAILGYSPEEAVAMSRDERRAAVHPEDLADLEAFLGGIAASMRDTPTMEREFRIRTKQGPYRWVRTSFALVRDAAGEPELIIGSLSDVTDRKRIAEQLQQAHKMETVGRLAGGVAHDFNNLLMVILGTVELARRKIGAGHPAWTHLEEISAAGQRAAALTRQLLAFARKQVIAPKVLDCNEVVAGTLKLLNRLIGEDIQLVWLPGTGLWPLHLDPGQIDQILANLCVNARDAMAGVGKLVIRTENATVPPDGPDDEAMPGDYVVLSVSDNGSGMDRSILEHIFEPFFTTKGQSKGTGLGLATVHGIVKQNGGFIHVQSAPEQGTTFRIYLPRFMGKAEGGAPPTPPPRPVGGTETILLVEDDPSVCATTREFLQQLGYTVLAACSADAALQLAADHRDDLPLLITDVIMPDMSGRDLARRLVQSRPNLKCLFISGYTADIIAHRGVLEEGVEFLPKPFTSLDLARKVRQVLSQ